MTNADMDYTENGGYSFVRRDWRQQVFIDERTDKTILGFTLTIPLLGPHSKDHPVVFFLSGFKLRASYYKDYAEKLASYGYLVVQYDVPITRTITDKKEIALFPTTLIWLFENFENSEFHGQFDFSKIGIVGHSRGGKLACLIANENPVVKALYLIDPVNGDPKFAPESIDYPSAVKALTGKGWKLGITGSEVSGSCNPTGYDFNEFWNISENESWLFTVNEAGHSQFFSAPFLVQTALDLLCTKGRTTCKEVIELTYPCMLAWLQQELPTRSFNDQSMSDDANRDRVCKTT
eukprot:g7815.t3